MTDFHEDDEDPQDIRAAFDRGPHGVTASGGARIVCGNGFADGGFGDSHKDCRAALDAAQDEIEKRIEDAESLRAAFTLAHAEVLKNHERVDAPLPWCRWCSTPAAFADWPCDPVRAIEDALGGAW